MSIYMIYKNVFCKRSCLIEGSDLESISGLLLYLRIFLLPNMKKREVLKS